MPLIQPGLNGWTCVQIHAGGAQLETVERQWTEAGFAGLQAQHRLANERRFKQKNRTHAHHAFRRMLRQGGISGHADKDML